MHERTEKLKRYYAQPSDIDGGLAVLSGEQYNHMANVMRAKIGDRVILCAGDGLDRESEIIAIELGRAKLKILSTVQNPNEPKLKLTAYCGLLKGDKLELAAQKLSELGAARLVPFTSAHTVAKSANLRRLERIAEESAKQCGRAGIMQVLPPIDFKGLLSALIRHTAVVFCNECEDERTLRQTLQGLRGIKDAAVITGCEGGFSTAEAVALKEAGALSVTLGGRILRAETAAIYAAGVVMYELDY